MSALASWLIGYVVNCLWMAPLVFGAAWIATSLMRRAGPALLHKVWVAALVMETVVPALNLRLEEISSMLLALWHGGAGATEGIAKLTMTAGAVQTHPGILLSRPVMVSMLGGYGCVTLYLTVQLLWRLARTREMARRAAGPVSEEVRMSLHRLADAFGLEGGSVRGAESMEVCGPATVGCGLLLLPQGFAERTAEEDLNAVLAHECAHIARQDFLKNLVYSVLALPCAFHPVMWVTKMRLAATREMVCDAMAADALRGRESYARSLLRLASAMVERGPGEIHAIGIFDANNLEGRVMNLTQKTRTTGRVLRAAMLAACGMIGVATVASALTLRVGVKSDGTGAARDPSADHQSAVTMPVLLHSVEPEYPKVAAEKSLNGTCLVSLIVDERGVPKDVRIVRSLRPDFDRNAIAAIQQYRFKPAMRNGEPVEKELKVEVRFARF